MNNNEIIGFDFIAKRNIFKKQTKPTIPVKIKSQTWSIYLIIWILTIVQTENNKNKYEIILSIQKAFITLHRN